MMRMTKPLFGTVKAMVMDSVFCVMRGLIGMLAHGVYGNMEIKKNDIGPSTEMDMPFRYSY